MRAPPGSFALAPPAPAASEFASAGYATRREGYDVRGVRCENVVAERRGARRPDSVVVLGAHYDSIPGCPGANDNASGVAILMSLIATCKANLVEPWAWLKDVLIQLPRGASLESLLPHTWLLSHPEHRWTIAERRQLERQRCSED